MVSSGGGTEDKYVCWTNIGRDGIQPTSVCFPEESTFYPSKALKCAVPYWGGCRHVRQKGSRLPMLMFQQARPLQETED